MSNINNQLYVGNTVYLEKLNNAIPRREFVITIDDLIVKTIITKIGKKYFYVEYCDLCFRLSDMFHNNPQYCSDYLAYFDKQAIIDKHESQNLYNNLKRKWFSGYGFQPESITLDQLKAIMDILEPKL